MARDYRAMEEEFIADLKSRSGRNLAEWMSAIGAQRLTARNDIIDWLQPQGFTFEHASWLERIHNNGGQPIYSGQTGERKPPSVPASRPAPVAPSPRAAGTRSVQADTDPAAVNAILARGKAYRMLAESLIGEVRRLLPGVAIGAAGDVIVFEHPALLAVLAVTPRELRLGLALGNRALEPPLLPPKGVGSDPAITRMVVLNDARQVDEALLELLRLAHRNANSRNQDH